MKNRHLTKREQTKVHNLINGFVKAVNKKVYPYKGARADTWKGFSRKAGKL